MEGLVTGHPRARYFKEEKSQEQMPVNVTLPVKITPSFAEFYGAMLGDGHLTKDIQMLCITCNGILDKWYVEEHLSSICRSLFNRNPRIYYPSDEQTIRFKIHSRSLARFFAKFGFPPGKKNKGLLEIPPCFFKNSEILAACLRGVLDTDGGIYPHPHTKIMLNLTTKSPTLLKSLQVAFQKLGIKMGITKYQLQIYGAEKIKRVMSKIGSSNPRNILRYQKFIETGTAPSAKETERLLKDGKYQFNVPFMSP